MIFVSGKDEVVVVDIKMPFWSIVVFLVKLSIAAIPAAIIIWFLGILVQRALVAMLGGM